MTISEAIEVVRREWHSQGECASCGWHATLYEYGNLADAVRINEDQERIELRCLSGEGGHRGVRIYYSSHNTGVGQ